MRQRFTWLLAAALAFAGCDDRRAGTETGNPEVTVTAYIMVSDYLTTRTKALNFRVMGMGYSIARPVGAPDSGKCWARPGGTLVNFAAPDSFALPDTAIEDAGTWPQAEIILRTPDGPAGIPDTADIGAWSNPRHVKFDLTIQGRTQLVVFEMPQGVEYRLLYDSLSTEFWRVDEMIWVPFNFNMWSWTDGLTSFQGMRTRRDGKGAAYLLLSPTENAAAWNALNARIQDCFYADSVIVR
jgi:hypothetical protein